MSPSAAVVLGLVFGLRHAADPDHLVVLTSLVERDRSPARAVRSALLWGAGHTTTFLVVGLAVVALGVKIPPAFERGAELVVAATLVVVGALHVARSRARPASCKRSPSRARGWLRPLVQGLVHGLAGSASIALLALSTIPSTGGALLFLGLFCAGTALGMAGITAALYVPVSFVAARELWRRRLSLAAGSASVVFGVALLAIALRSGS